MNLVKSISHIERLIGKLLKKESIIMLGIAGGSGSGKTYLARRLGYKTISIDDYYIGIDNMKDNNFDHPKALDLKLLRKHLVMLKKSKPIIKPVYSFITHKRDGYEKIGPDKIMIVEGLFALNKMISDVFDIKIFVDSSKERRLQRRIKRDINERGRISESIKMVFDTVAEPMYIKHVMPTKKSADLIIRN